MMVSPVAVATLFQAPMSPAPGAVVETHEAPELIAVAFAALTWVVCACAPIVPNINNRPAICVVRQMSLVFMNRYGWV